MNKLDDSVEEIIQLLKEEYEKPQMSQEQLGELRAKMKEADRMNNKERRNAKFIRLAVAAAVLIGIFMILPIHRLLLQMRWSRYPSSGSLLRL